MPCDEFRHDPDRQILGARGTHVRRHYSDIYPSFSKRFAVYGSITDLNGSFNPATLRYAASTPAYARMYRYQELGVCLTLGIKGQF